MGRLFSLAAASTTPARRRLPLLAAGGLLTLLIAAIVRAGETPGGETSAPVERAGDEVAGEKEPAVADESTESLAATTPEERQFFEAHIRPLLLEHCAECHAADDPSGSLRLDGRGWMLAGGDSGPAIVPHQPDESLLLEAVRYESYEMPPSGRLPDESIDLLARWVEMGAPWPGDDGRVRETKRGPRFDETDRAWWAIQPLRDAQPPALDDVPDGWEQPLDRFVLAAMQQRGLHPAPPAERVDLIRRVTFDLTGLPPTPEEVDAFLADDRADAYEHLVDRLLASDEYGRRWARHWLDLVRYAESDGYKNDFYRPLAYRYRDYVIDALNEDRPYDRFVQEQLAADELFPDDPDAWVGLGYLWSGIYEHNNRDVVGHNELLLNELTDTTADVFLGLGLQCAKCHDHKFDPLLQRDYYQLRAFFEPIEFLDAAPLATAAEQREHTEAHAAWETKTASIRARIEAIREPHRQKAYTAAYEKFPPDIKAMIDRPESDRTPRQQQLVQLSWRQMLEEYAKVDTKVKGEEKAELTDLLKQLATIPEPTLPRGRIARDLAAGIPPTTIPKKRTEVQPGRPRLLDEIAAAAEVPAIVAQQRSDGDPSTGRRTALARWITAPSNSLTTRVITNRLWASHFGRGLAPNGSDFGTLGGPPSHPELLDWLTKRFVEGGWRMKPMHRLLVTSATYRQSSTHPDAERLEPIAPSTEWYWRARVRRLDAEQVRDAILAATGQLQDRGPGPSAKHGTPVRSIYLKVIRNTRLPLLDAFDLPQFFASTSRRDRTTTPLQSLLLLNSEPMLKAAAAMADDLASHPDVVGQAWRRTMGRAPSTEERAAAEVFLHSQAQRLRESEDSTDDSASELARSAMPRQNGVALDLAAEPKSPRLAVADAASLRPREFTVEAVFLVRSIFKSGRVRPIVAKAGRSHGEPSWTLGVTGEGSRRRPQTLVMHLFGQLEAAVAGDVAMEQVVREQAVFSDQHIALDTPYHVAASVSLATPTQPGTVRFELTNLSRPGTVADIAEQPHRIARPLASDAPLSIGWRGGDVFDGLISRVRLSEGVLPAGQTLATDEAVTPSTLADWSFAGERPLRDRGPRGFDLQRLEAGQHQPPDASPAEREALADLCHVLLNSSEFLYVD